MEFINSFCLLRQVQQLMENNSLTLVGSRKKKILDSVLVLINCSCFTSRDPGIKGKNIIIDFFCVALVFGWKEKMEQSRFSERDRRESFEPERIDLHLPETEERAGRRVRPFFSG